jgi:hypothetical protein
VAATIREKPCCKVGNSDKAISPYAKNNAVAGESDHAILRLSYKCRKLVTLNDLGRGASSSLRDNRRSSQWNIEKTLLRRLRISRNYVMTHSLGDVRALNLRPRKCRGYRILSKSPAKSALAYLDVESIWRRPGTPVRTCQTHGWSKGAPTRMSTLSSLVSSNCCDRLNKEVFANGLLHFID